ncbi:uncharacterized protein LOC144750170 isoform X2 [Ciona intestinalis]
MDLTKPVTKNTGVSDPSETPVPMVTYPPHSDRVTAPPVLNTPLGTPATAVETEQVSDALTKKMCSLKVSKPKHNEGGASTSRVASTEDVPNPGTSEEFVDPHAKRRAKRLRQKARKKASCDNPEASSSCNPGNNRPTTSSGAASGQQQRKRTRAVKSSTGSASSTPGAKRHKGGTSTSPKGGGGKASYKEAASSALRLDVRFATGTDPMTPADIAYINNLLVKAMVDDTFPGQPPNSTSVTLMASGNLRIVCKDETSLDILRTWLRKVPARPGAPSGYIALGPQDRPKERMFIAWIPCPDLRGNYEQFLPVIGRQNPEIPIDKLRVVSAVGNGNDYGFHLRIAVQLTALPSLRKANFQLNFLLGLINLVGSQAKAAEEGSESPGQETNPNNQDGAPKTG